MKEEISTPDILLKKFTLAALNSPKKVKNQNI